MKTLRFGAALLMVAVMGCVQTEEGDDWSEETGESAQAATSPVLTYTMVGGEAGSPTNGKKVVVSGGLLHAVYSVNGAVYYRSSADGATWSTAVTLESTGASAPTIAADSSGRIGVAYVKATGFNEELYYRHKPSGGAWAAAVKIANDTSVSTPSMVADGTKMHVAWASTPVIKYMEFTASTPPSSASPEWVTGVPGGLDVSVFSAYPSVAVSAGPSGSRVVRVGLLYALENDITGAGSVGLYLAQRSGWSSFNDVAGWDPYATPYAGSFAMHSLSMDANPSTGDFYVAASYTYDSNARTYLYHQNAFGTALPDKFQLSTSASTVSMASRRQQCVNKVRVQWSPATFYGATQYRTATWASGPSPTWIDAAPVALPGPGSGLSSNAFASTSLIGQIALSGTLNTRRFHGLYDTWNGGNSFTLAMEHDTIPTPAPCD